MNAPEKHDSVLRDLFDTVKTLRDEIRVQAHLAKRDAADELDHLEEKWQSVDKRRHEIQDVAEETASEARAGLRLVLEELREGYRKIRDSL